MQHILIIITLLFGFHLNTSFAQQKKVDLATFTVTIPEGMTHVPVDGTTSLKFKMSYDNIMHITIGDNMNKMLEEAKKGPKSELQPFADFAFDTKFEAIKNQYQGYDASKKEFGTFRKYKYASQKFTCKASKTQEATLEYRVIEIGGIHYEFIITGKKVKEAEQAKLVKAFWEGIVVR